MLVGWCGQGWIEKTTFIHVALIVVDHQIGSFLSDSLWRFNTFRGNYQRLDSQSVLVLNRAKVLWGRGTPCIFSTYSRRRLTDWLSLARTSPLHNRRCADCDLHRSVWFMTFFRCAEKAWPPSFSRRWGCILPREQFSSAWGSSSTTIWRGCWVLAGDRCSHIIAHG